MRMLTVQGLRCGEVNDVSSMRVAPDGKGTNIAGVIQLLGDVANCTGLIDGHADRLFATSAAQGSVQRVNQNGS